MQARTREVEEKNRENPDPARLLQFCNFFSPDDSSNDADLAVVRTRQENQAVLNVARQSVKYADVERLTRLALPVAEQREHNEREASR